MSLKERKDISKDAIQSERKGIKSKGNVVITERKEQNYSLCETETQKNKNRDWVRSEWIIGWSWSRDTRREWCRAVMNRRHIPSFCERWLQCQITDSPLLITRHTGPVLTAVISPWQECHRTIIFTHTKGYLELGVYRYLSCVGKLVLVDFLSLFHTHTHTHTLK